MSFFWQQDVTAQQSDGSGAAADSWSMFQGDPSHLGTSNSTAPTTNQTLWGYNTQTPDSWGSSPSPVVSSPAIVGGIVYFGSDSGIVYAVNATTGASIWNFTTGYLYVRSSPAVSNGIVYIGSDDGNFYALNASTGTQIWSYKTNADSSAPVISDGVLYVNDWLAYYGPGLNTNGILALNATTGTKIRIYQINCTTFTPPAVVNGLIYTASSDNNTYAFNASTGIQLWNFTTSGQFESSPSVAQGIVYVGSDDSNMTALNPSYIYALNASTGVELWSYLTSGPVDSCPAVYDSIVYVASTGGNLYALNALTGSQVWVYSAHGLIFGSPVVAGGLVFDGVMGVSNGNFFALSSSTGALVWTATIGGMRASPAVATGIVYVGSDNGDLYAFGDNPGLINSQPTLISVTSEYGTSPVTLNVTVTGNNPTGTITWITNTNSGTFSQKTTKLVSGNSTTTYTDNTGVLATIVACYSGDARNCPSCTNAVVIIRSTPTPSPNPNETATSSPTQTLPTATNFAPSSSPTNNSNSSPQNVPELSWFMILPLLLSLFFFAVLCRHRKNL